MNEPKPAVSFLNENGNTFNLIGICRRALRRAGASQAHIDKFVEEATSGDYDNALIVMQRYCEITMDEEFLT